MADEAQFTGDNIDWNSVMQYNYATGTAIVKGALFILDETRPYTVITHGTSGDVIPAGFVVEDRDSDDTQQDRIGLFRKGNILVVADGVIAVGDLLVPGTTANRVASLGAGNSTASSRRIARVIGVAKEASAAGRYFFASIDIK